MNFYKLDRNFYSSGVDYSFDKIEHFENMLPYLYPKIEGSWKIDLVDLRIDDVRRILDTMKVPEHAEINCYLKADVLGILLAENPSINREEKSKWEQYMDLVSVFPKMIEKRASSELFRRCRGSIELIRDTLDELKIVAEDVDTVTMKHVNAVIIASETVYARDVILTLMLKHNIHVDKRGEKLSRYKYGNYLELYQKLEEELGRSIAFLSLRKFLKYLYEEKLKYLKNEEVKEIELMRVIDVYDITHAYMLFFMSNSLQTIPCLYMMERRIIDVSDFRKTLLS